MGFYVPQLICYFTCCRFKDLYHNLKDMKSEIEHSQHLLEKAKVQLQKDFEVWWEKEAKKTKVCKSKSFDLFAFRNHIIVCSLQKGHIHLQEKCQKFPQVAQTHFDLLHRWILC